MTALTVTLLGRPQIDVAGQPVAIKSQKAQALLFYLVMTRQNYSRQSLAGLLWGDLDEASARRNLRVELLKLRAAVGTFIASTRETIGLNRQRDYTIDVKQFEHCLHGHEPTFAELQEASALYQGEFLEDFHVRDAPLFEEWVTTERERLSQMARQTLLRLVEYHIQQHAFDRGFEAVSQLLRREPWLEEAHQQMMRLLALNGQRSAALTHYEHASRILDDEFGVPPSDETNALYDQIESGFFEGESSPLAPRLPAAPAGVQSPPFQSPAPQLHFVGRTDELAALAEQLVAPGGNRRVALVGMAGVGKTTLTAQIAHDLRSHFVDGVLWAYTAESDPLDILGSWAQALGYDFSSLSDVENRAAALRGILADKQLLFVLDDVRSVARVRSLFVGGANSATLLTTRDLDVAAALNAQAYPLAEMTPHDGEQLLVRILGEERVQREVAAARQICTLLQNLPLAVEIAAQRLRSRPRRRLVDMAARLHDMQERLDLAISDRAVRTSFTVSWESLDQEQQWVFSLLGLFGGRSFAVPALAHVAELDLYTTEDRLFTLMTLSLLSEEESAHGAAPRYRQHPLLADFAKEQLRDERAVQLRLIHYYLTFAQEQRTTYTRLQPEWGNLIAGLQMAHVLQEWQLVLAYADALTDAWFTRARYTEARAAYALAKEAAEMLGNEQALADCLLRWGRACVEQNDLGEARGLLAESQQLFATLQNQSGQAEVEYYLARLSLEQGDHPDALQWLDSSRRLREALGDTVGIASVYYQQAFLNYLQGKWQEAQSLCVHALGMYEVVKYEAGIVPTLRLLADIALELEEYDLAVTHCQRALTLCEKLHDQGELTATYYSLTVVARVHGDITLAEGYAKEALTLSRLIGNRLFQALTLHELSRIYGQGRSHDHALPLADESLQLLRDLDDNFNQVYLLRHLGDLHKERGDHQQSLRYWSEGIAIAQRTEHPLMNELHQRMNRAQESLHADD